MTGRVAGWGVVVPVKLLTHAKTRLSTYGDDARAELALAFAGDVVDTSLACPSVVRVLVVTDDVRAARALDLPGVTVVPDLPDGGLNPALEYGAELLREAETDLAVAALSSDLPALRAEELAAVLATVLECEPGRAFVADAPGEGTTLLAAREGHPLAPSYGLGSRARHLASGAVELPGSPGRRPDVETPEDLQEVLRLGLGRRTGAVVARLPGPP